MNIESMYAQVSAKLEDSRGKEKDYNEDHGSSDRLGLVHICAIHISSNHIVDHVSLTDTLQRHSNNTGVYTYVQS